MARKKEISYFTDLSTEEDFEKFMEQEALIRKIFFQSSKNLLKNLINVGSLTFNQLNIFLSVLDVYQEILGPCTVGMHGSIEKIKVIYLN